MKDKRPRVLIAGGGVAGLEALLALRALAGHQLDITLLAPEPRFVYRPVTVGEPFDRAEARVYTLSSIAAEHDVTLVPGALERVDPARRAVITRGGERLSYDRLLIAVGAPARDSVPGALNFRGRDSVPEMRELLGQLLAGGPRSVAFTLPARDMWPLPLYELALLTAQHLASGGVGAVSVTLVTPEEEPLELFGPAASAAVKLLLERRRIALRNSATPAVVDSGALVLLGGDVVFADRVVTLARPDGPAVAGLPHDWDGFIPVDRHGRVRGVQAVYAAGDATDFPLKQGGLAAQQADAASEQIAAELGVAIRPAPFRPVLRGLLMTGGPPLYLRAEVTSAAARSGLRIGPGRVQRAGGQAPAATGQPLWWPPAKVAGRYLAPYLTTAHPTLFPEPLVDRAEVPGPPVSEAEQDNALELSLILADLDARFGDYRSALEALDAAEAVRGALPPEYEARRRKWRHAAEPSYGCPQPSPRSTF